MNLDQAIEMAAKIPGAGTPSAPGGGLHARDLPDQGLASTFAPFPAGAM